MLSFDYLCKLNLGFRMFSNILKYLLNLKAYILKIIDQVDGSIKKQDNGAIVIFIVNAFLELRQL